METRPSGAPCDPRPSRSCRGASSREHSPQGPALVAAQDRDLRSRSLSALLCELDPEAAHHGQRQARKLDKLDAPTRYPDALGDELPADVFGPEDGEAALQAATERLNWAAAQLG